MDWKPGHVYALLDLRDDNGEFVYGYVKLDVGQPWRFVYGQCSYGESMPSVALTIEKLSPEGEVTMGVAKADLRHLTRKVADKHGQQNVVPAFKVNKDGTVSAHEAWDVWHTDMDHSE